ncbi:hypothetical protein MMC07_006603 [Pseudocyphellaria aurata]|nr:hypothetical protein [Pseudocyphellaria aurata]
MNEGVQKSFSEITGMKEPGGQNITPDPELSIHNTTETTQRRTALTDRESQRMEQTESQKQKRLVEEAESEGDEAVVQSIVEPRLRALKERQASRLHAESVYNNPGGKIGIPKYGPSLEPAIRGGPDFPTIYARVLTLAEIEDLQKQLRLCENELLQRDIPKAPRVNKDPIPKPRLRRDLIERRSNGDEYPQAQNDEHAPLPLQLEGFLERSNGEKHRQARSNESETPSLQPENISERRSRDTIPKTVQSQALDSTVMSNQKQQMVTWSSEKPSPLHSPDDPKLPDKPKNLAYYCDVCLINITRFSLDTKKKHAQACSTTISNTLTLTREQAAAAKKQKATDDEEVKKEAGPPDSVAKIQVDNSNDKNLSKEGLGGSDGGPHWTGRGTKRKSTMLPKHGAKKAQK